MPKTILILEANPKDTQGLQLNREIREIENGLQRAQRRDEFILKPVLAARPIDVRRAMLQFRPSIVHFCGHGAGHDGIVFEDDAGNATLVSAAALSGLFKLFADQVECVVLNACYTEEQAEVISQHIPYVVGMEQAIEDDAARDFAIAFYDAIGAGRSFEFAHEFACTAIQWAGLPDNMKPVLKTRPVQHTDHLFPVPVRTFCILTSFCSDSLKELLLRQNQSQPFFDIGIANSWKFWPGRMRSEEDLASFQTNSRLSFCEKFQQEMTRYNHEFDPFPANAINLAITELPFPKNYYTWNTRDRKGIVIGIHSLRFLFQDHPETVQKIIIRVVQRMLLHSLQIEGLIAHEDTRGCLFDLTRELMDMRFATDVTRLCTACEAAMRRERGEQFVTQVQKWLAHPL
ncbi:MAG: CHAT domain-containing protein [Caldilineaceae bacterium]